MRRLRVDAGLVHRLPQQPPGRSHEGFALLVLLVAGLLADEDNARRRAALGKDGLGGVREQRVAPAVGSSGYGRIQAVEMR